MFEKIINFFKKMKKVEEKTGKSKDAAKERLHLVLMQDRANISADFLELMKQEIIDVIKKYIEIDENAIDVRLTNKTNEDGSNGAPALYANIPITNIKSDMNEFAKIQKHEDVNKNTNTENNDNGAIVVPQSGESDTNVVDSISIETEKKEKEPEKQSNGQDEIKEEIEKKKEALEEIKEAEEIKEKIETEIEEEKKEEDEGKREEKESSV